MGEFYIKWIYKISITLTYFFNAPGGGGDRVSDFFFSPTIAVCKCNGTYPYENKEDIYAVSFIVDAVPIV